MPLKPLKFHKLLDKNQFAGACSLNTDPNTDPGRKGNSTGIKKRAGSERLDSFKCSATFKDKDHQELLNSNKAANPFAFFLNNRCCTLHDNLLSTAQVGNYF